MSLFDKTQIKIEKEVIDNFKKDYQYLVHKKFRVPELDTSHEILIIPTIYEKYLENVKTLLDSRDPDNDTQDILFDTVVSTALSQIIYPIITMEDFNKDENPSDFIYSVASLIQEAWEIILEETLYYDDSYSPEKSKEYFELYKTKLEECKKVNKFCYGISLETQFKTKQFFIVNKLTNSETIKVFEYFSKYVEDKFDSCFSYLASNHINLIKKCQNKNKLIDMSLFSQESEGIVPEEVRKKIYKSLNIYNDYITLNSIYYYDDAYRALLKSKILFSHPIKLEDAPAPMAGFVMQDLQQPFKISKALDLDKVEDVIDSFCEINKLEKSDLLQLLFTINNNMENQ